MTDTEQELNRVTKQRDALIEAVKQMRTLFAQLEMTSKVTKCDVLIKINEK